VTIRSLIMAGAFVLAVSHSMSAVAQTVTVPAGETRGRVTLGDGQGLVVRAGGTVAEAGTSAVQASGGGITMYIDNAGAIQSGGSATIDATFAVLNLNNRRGGVIFGTSFDLIAAHRVQTLVNDGTLVGGVRDVVFADEIGSFINNGLITGKLGIIADRGKIDSLVNTGTMDFTGAMGVYGRDGIDSVFNTGLIRTAPQDVGLGYAIASVGNIGTVVNRGTLEGDQGIVSFQTIGSVVNSGIINGVTERGIRSANLGYLDNNGAITGGLQGIILTGTLDQGTNSGLIWGGDTGILATAIESLTNAAGGQIIGAINAGIQAGTATRLNNAGTISGAVNGVDIATIGSLDNAGTLWGGENGLSATTIGALHNSGAITGDDNGIRATTIGALTNDAGGAISGGRRTGIWVHDIGSIVNGGTISGQIISVYASSIGTLVNTGIIESANTPILSSVSIDSVINSGSIIGLNYGVIALDRIGSFYNTGTVLADTAVTSHNIASLINSGTIQGRVRAVDAEAITSLVNSGRIIGGTGAIREIAAADTQLTLLKGSLIEGGIDLGGGVNTLNVGRGLSIDSVFSSSTPLVIGDMAAAPYLYQPLGGNSYRVATVDPTSFLAHDELMADLTGAMFGAIDNHLDNTRSTQPMGYAAPAAVVEELARFEDVSNAMPHLWAEGFGTFRDQPGSGAMPASSQRLAGFVSGMDTPLSQTTLAGLFGGIAWSQVSDGSGQTTKALNGFAGAYGSAQLGAGFIDVAISAGHAHFDGTRPVANNGVAGGLQTAGASYDGWFISPQIKVTQPLGLLEASGSLRYAGLFLDGFSETGTNRGVVIDGRTAHLLVARAALTAPLAQANDNGDVMRLAVTGGIEARTQFGSNAITGQALGQTIAFDAGHRDGYGVFAGLKLQYQTSSTLQLFSDTEGQKENDGTFKLSAKAGLKAAF